MTKPKAPAIIVKRASLIFQDNILFQNLDLTLSAGKWTVLLGPSGVGKTSLLRLIAGLNTDAHSPNPVQASDQLPLSNRISYMPQDDLLLPWLTVLHNVLITEKLRGVLTNKNKEEYQNRALQLLERVGLAQTAKQLPDTLSGGMRQRVALTRTFLEACPIVLMDEPFSALDAITRLELQTLAAELLADRTVLLITHDPLEALRLGDEIYVMADHPAKLSAPIHPPGEKPRNTNDARIMQLQAELLKRLVEAKK
jgi:putative hydroxymethylpyrimidine transport system ATP-binding protein